MGHVIIIDGPRGVGKSTAAQTIVDLLNAEGIDAEYFKKGLRSEANELFNMLDHIDRFKAAHHITVVDRFVLTEWVHSIDKKRAEPQQLYSNCYYVDELIADENWQHYVLIADAKVLEARIAERGTRENDMNHGDSYSLWAAAAGVFESVTPIYVNTFENLDLFIHRVVERVVTGTFTLDLPLSWEGFAK